MGRQQMWTVLVALMLAVAGCAQPRGEATQEGQRTAEAALDPAFEQFVDKYLREVRGVGGNLPADMSAASFAQRLETQRALLAELEELDRTKLSFDQHIDSQFLDGIL